MMWPSIRIPGVKEMDAFLETERKKAYTYAEVGATATGKPTGYDNDYTYSVIGQGDLAWEKAKTTLRNWQHFPKPWTKIYPDTTPLQKNEQVAVLFRLWGWWWCNSARIVYVIDEVDRFGFAYGTLPGHIECGEECFWLSRDEAGVVTYHIRAFSKPRFWLVRLGYPLARFYQRKFVRDSMEQMKNRIGN